MAVSPSDLLAADTLLARALGRYTERHPEPEADLLTELVECLIGQRTTASHTALAMANLRRLFRSWAEVAAADPDTLAEALRPAGLARQKAGRLREVLARVHGDAYAYSLEFLHDLSPHEARAYLRSLPGVGEHTAALVLAFAGRLPGVMPVEAHIDRVSRRLGWVPGGSARAAAQRGIESAGAEMRMIDLHVNLIRVGRHYCKESVPDCPECPLADLCPSFRLPW